VKNVYKYFAHFEYVVNWKHLGPYALVIR